MHFFLSVNILIQVLFLSGTQIIL